MMSRLVCLAVPHAPMNFTRVRHVQEGMCSAMQGHERAARTSRGTESLSYGRRLIGTGLVSVQQIKTRRKEDGSSLIHRE